MALGASATLAAGAIGMVEVTNADVANPAIDDTLSMETVVEDFLGSSESDSFSEHPTLIEENSETVRIEDDAELKIDPVPTDDEVQSLDVPDVELSPDRELSEDALSETIEFQPTDLDAETHSTEIKPLRNEESFDLDEDSLRLTPDPLTGELTYPISGNSPPPSMTRRLNRW